MRKVMAMIVATLTYIRSDGKTLMLHRNKKLKDYHEGKYNGIGGKLEAGESPEMCAKREIFEETGLHAKSICYRGHLTFPQFDGVSDWLCFIYECHKFEGELIDSDEGTLYWIEDQELLNLNLWEGDPYFLKVLYGSSAHFSGIFYYKNKQLLDYELIVNELR
jgi:8-oxo-dGTP diphosphatase